MNLADLLKKSIDSTHLDLIRRIADDASEFGFPVYLVGGSVRDLLLGRQITDFDLTFEGNAISLARSLARKYDGKITVHEKFHTATFDLRDSKLGHPISNIESLDLISARKETYSHPGALPTVTKSTIDDDLRRRDFTINAMAIRVDGDGFGELLDPLGGQKDIDKKLFRVLHPKSFVDDPTRIFRAVRYAARYGFEIESETLKLINDESLQVLASLSGERLRHEIDVIFAEKDYSSMFAQLAEMQVLSAIELPDFDGKYSSLTGLLPEEKLGVQIDRVTLGYLLWLADSSLTAIQNLSNRLAFTAELTEVLSSASTLKQMLPDLKNGKPSAWTFAIEKFPLAAIYGVYLMTNEKPLLDYLSTWRHVKPVTTGDDLKARGLESGPRFGEILRQLRAAWLDGEVKNEKEELKLLDKLPSFQK